MSEHKRLYNLLQLISLLGKPGGYPVKRLAERFQVTSRTIYRYFDILRECGFEIEKSGGRHRFRNSAEVENLLPLFSEEEAAVVNKAVLSLHSGHFQKVALLKKLRILSGSGHISELITNAKTSRAVSLLLEAIRGRKRVILHHYHSPSSDTVLDRAADPIGFSINMKYLYAFEPEHQKVVQFKPERIGRVEITADSFETNERYRIEKPDLFGMSGAHRAVVSLQLNRRALHLLLEEFPESAAILEKDLTGFQNLSGLQNNLKVKLPVKGFEGVGRFVLGLPGEANALGPPEFLRYLEERMNRSTLFRNVKKVKEM